MIPTHELNISLSADFDDHRHIQLIAGEATEISSSAFAGLFPEPKNLVVDGGPNDIVNGVIAVAFVFAEKR